MSFLVFSDFDFRPGREFAACMAAIVFLGVSPVVADEASNTESRSPGSSGMPFEAVPDIREDDVPLKVQKGDLVAVPIPMSNPTLGTGLMGGAAYFYPQTEGESHSPASADRGRDFRCGERTSWRACRVRLPVAENLRRLLSMLRR